MTLDLAIRGGTVVTASDAFKADVGVRDGRIVALAETLDAPDAIDATGKLVLPGGVEAHCHIAQESATGGMTADDYFTDGLDAALRGFRHPGGPKIDCVTLAEGPFGIESQLDSDAVALPLARPRPGPRTTPPPTSSPATPTPGATPAAR